MTTPKTVASIHFVGTPAERVDFEPNFGQISDPDTFITFEERDNEADPLVPASLWFWDHSVYAWAPVNRARLLLVTSMDHVTDNSTNSSSWIQLAGAGGNPWELAVAMPPGINDAVLLASFGATVSNAVDGGVIDFRMMVDHGNGREEVFRSATRVATPWSDQPVQVTIPKKLIQISELATVSIDWKTSGVAGSTAQILSASRAWENAAMALELVAGTTG